MSAIKKVVLAYSGGLDTSVILKWLQDTYKCEVVTFTADIGQGEELEPARAKAQKALHEDMARLAVGGAERILRKKLDEAEQRRLIGEFVAEAGELR